VLAESGWRKMVACALVVKAIRPAALLTGVQSSAAPAVYDSWRAGAIVGQSRCQTFAGGLATTLVNSGQQWDAPNGWAPLQWIAVVGLRPPYLGDGPQEVLDGLLRVWFALVVGQSRTRRLALRVLV